MRQESSSSSVQEPVPEVNPHWITVRRYSNAAHRKVHRYSIDQCPLCEAAVLKLPKDRRHEPSH